MRKLLPLPTTIEGQSKHKHQCEQLIERKSRPPSLPMLGRTAGGLLRFLSAWEFESRVFPEIPKFGGFASPARYFYFTLSDFSNMRLLFLITLVFLLCVQKSRTSVRDFCLHLFCQCKLVRVGRLELPASCSQSRRATNCATPGYKSFNRGQRRLLTGYRRGKNTGVSCVPRASRPSECYAPNPNLLCPKQARCQLHNTPL